MNSYALGIDIGTTYTAAGITRRGTGGALVGTALELGSRKAAMPTVAYLAQDGAVVVGEPAERRAIDAPDRVVRGFKRRIGDETPLIVGDLAVAPEELFALLAGWVVERAEEQEGEPPTSITISHPAAWGAHRIESIRGALEAAGLGHADLVSEPEAAGLKYLSEHHLDDGRVIAVYDLGGGTFDVALLRRSGEDGLELVGAPRGIDRLGGTDFDQLVFDHVRTSAEDAFGDLEEDSAEAAVALARVRRECTEAKEALSFDAETSVPVALPSGHARVRLVRSEFEQMIEPDLRRTVETLRETIDAAGLELDDLDAVLLIGGSSRIPAVTQLISSELGLPVAIDADPKASISHGAAIAAARHLESAPDDGATSAAPEPVGDEVPADPAEDRRRALPAWLRRTPDTPGLSMGLRTTLLAGAAAALLGILVPITPLGAGGEQGEAADGAAELEASGTYAAGRYVAGDGATGQAGSTARPPADDPFTRADESELEQSTGPLKPGRSSTGGSEAPSGSTGTKATPGGDTTASGSSPGGSSSPPTTGSDSSPSPTTDPSPTPDPEPSPDPAPVPEPDPAPDPSPEPDPAPDPSTEPDPVPDPSPEPSPEPAPEPEPTVTSEPTEPPATP